jgi:hypothetical protein
MRGLKENKIVSHHMGYRAVRKTYIPIIDNVREKEPYQTEWGLICGIEFGTG